MITAKSRRSSGARSTRPRGGGREKATLAIFATAMILASIATPASGSPRAGKAHTARSLNVHDEGRLRFIKSSGSQLLDEGRASGSVPGNVKVRFTYNGEPTVYAQFTIYAGGGTISARASGKLSSPASPSPSFRGTMTTTGGSGRYAHIHGRGELFGVFSRRSYGLTVQAIGKLSY